MRRPAPVPPRPHLRPLQPNLRAYHLSWIPWPRDDIVRQTSLNLLQISCFVKNRPLTVIWSTKKSTFSYKYDGMTDINRIWTNLVRKMLCVWPQHASKHHISENKYLFISRERSILVATPTYVPIHTLLFRVPLPMMKSTMGYTSNNNCAKPSYFPSNSVCQCNQNSKMC